MGSRFPAVSPLLIILVVAFVVLALPDAAFAQERHDVDLRALPSDVDEDKIREIQGLRYSSGSRKLIWQSESKMSTDIRDTLLDMSSDSAWRTAVNALYELAKPTLETRGGQGEPFQLRAEDFPLTTALLGIADQYKLNIVCSKDVKGSVTLQIDNVPVMTALTAMLESQGYEFQKIENPLTPDGSGDVYVVVTKQKKSPELKEEIIPVMVSQAGRVPIDFAQLTTQLKNIGSQFGSLVANNTSQVLIVKDTPEAIASMQRYIKAVRDNAPKVDEIDRIQDDRKEEDEPATEEVPEELKTTKKLYDVPVRQLDNALEQLKRLLGSRPLVINDREGIILVDETAETHALVDDYLKRLKALIGEPADTTPAERMDTRVYTLKQAADSVKLGLDPFLTPEKGRIVVNAALNSLVVTDLYTNFNVLERYIRELDATPQQVHIESTVVEATLDDSTNFGIAAFWNRGVGSGQLGYQGVSFDPNASAPQANGSPFRSFQGATYNFGFLQGSEWEVALNAITTTTNANILSRPKLVVANNKKGSIKVGREVPYVDVQGGAAGATQGVSFKEINLQLDVTPHIEPGDVIRLEIDFQFDTQQGTANLGGAVGGGQPIVNNRSILTEVYVNDGETLVIGGLYDDRENDTVNKVPILGDLPVLGLLFRDTITVRQRTDLLFIIQPTIVRDRKIIRITRLGRELKVYRPDSPQIPDWYRDRNFSRLSSGDATD